MKNNTVVTVGDINYLWGLFMLIASMRKSGMDEPVLVGAHKFTPEAEDILKQLGDVTIFTLKDIDHSLTCYKPLVMLQAQTEYITWVDSDGYFVGNCSKRLPPLSPEEIHARMRSPEENPGAFRNFEYGEDGRSIPFIFRPFHEYNTAWFWWGEPYCTDEEFRALWRMFHDYMDQQLPTNIIWSFSSNLYGNWTMANFLRRYPGNDIVDMMGCEAYQLDDDLEFSNSLKSDLAFLDKFAHDNTKLLAITECGINSSARPDWWSSVLMPLLEPYAVSYILAWRNWQNKCYGPSKDEPTAEDFLRLYEQHKLLFMLDIRPGGIEFGRDASELLWL